MYTYNLPTNSKFEEFEKYNYLFISLRGVFLALILFCASFLSPYIGCNYQHIIKTQPYLRYIVLFLVIYFSINLANPNSKAIENPLYSIYRSIFVFFIFILLNNIPLNTIIIILTFFALLLLTSKYYTYYQQDNNKFNTTLDILQILQWTIVFAIILILFISIFDKSTTHTSLTLDKCNI